LFQPNQLTAISHKQFLFSPQKLKNSKKSGKKNKKKTETV